MKKYILINKLKILFNEVEKCQNLQNDKILIEVLENYKQRILKMIEQVQNGQILCNKNIPPILIGILRPISEYDSLSQNIALYEAASEVESYFGKYFTYKNNE